MAEMVPRKKPKHADDFLDETEVITRIYYTIHKFSLLDLEKFEWGVSTD